jgi:hypothetical protein
VERNDHNLGRSEAAHIVPASPAHTTIYATTFQINEYRTVPWSRRLIANVSFWRKAEAACRPWSHVRPLDSEIGRPSNDPGLMIRMLIMGYGSGIRSLLLQARP